MSGYGTADFRRAFCVFLICWLAYAVWSAVDMSIVRHRQGIVRTAIVQIHGVRLPGDSTLACFTFTQRDGKVGVGRTAAWLVVEVDTARGDTTLALKREVRVAGELCAISLDSIGVKVTTYRLLPFPVDWTIRRDTAVRV